MDRGDSSPTEPCPGLELSKRIVEGGLVAGARGKRASSPYTSKPPEDLTWNRMRRIREEGIEVLVARYSGFCPGVKRAIRMAESLLKSRGKAWSLGPVIHNPQVVGELERRGLGILPENPLLWEEIDLEGETVLIRSHGVSPSLLKRLQERGSEVVDATCPKVRRAQQVDEELVSQGYHLVIVGNPEHPEITAIVDRFPKPPTVLPSPESASEWVRSGPIPPRVAVTAQTTAGDEIFRKVVEILAAHVPEIKVVDTLCEVTKRRQREAAEIARVSDLVIVVGGMNSSNTRQLARIAGEYAPRVIQVERADEIDGSVLSGLRTIGILGGASTPEDEVNRVVKRVLDLHAM